MVAITVLQHQPEVCNKLCYGLILLVDKLVFHPPQAHRLPELCLTPAPDPSNTMLGLLVADGMKEWAGDPFVLVQEKASEYPIGLLYLIVHILLKAIAVGGNAHLRQREVTVRKLWHDIIAQCKVVTLSSYISTVARTV